MGGGGGGGWWRSRAISGYVKPSNAAYEGSVNEYLRDLLSDYNNRDTAAIHRHLETLKQAICSDIEGSVEMLFGGSVKKHTAVDGLSDVDTLLVINQSSLADSSPQEVLDYLEQRLRSRLPNTAIKIGQLAVTVEYSDGIQVQLLPALKTPTGIRIADGNAWSQVVRPHKFAEQLTAVNQRCGNQVVPTIKLFKGLQSGQPKDQQLSGYHIESLAVEAFRNYEDRRTPKDMLTHLVRYAKERVLAPMAESTGQSVHVDDKLGEANSVSRQRIAAGLERLSEKLAEAERRGDTQIIKGLFDT